MGGRRAAIQCALVDVAEVITSGPHLAAPFTVSERMSFRLDCGGAMAQAYFAHGSISVVPKEVADAQERWLRCEREEGAHGAIRACDNELSDVRTAVARLIGAEDHQIALMESASRAWAMGFAAALDAGYGKTTISSVHEWGGNALNILHARRQGRIGTVLRLGGEPCGMAQALQVQAEGYADERKPIVSFPLLPAASGVPRDFRGVAEWVRHRDGLLMIDASHAVGHLPVDVGHLECDILVFPARKWLRGPRGIAVLYVSDRALTLLGPPSMLDVAGASFFEGGEYVVRDDARRFETFDYSPALHMGLKAACDYALDANVARIAATNIAIAQKIAGRLTERSGIGIVPLEGTAQSAMLNYALNPVDTTMLLDRLARAGVSANIIDHTLCPWRFEALWPNAQLRITPHYMTSDDDIERLVDAVALLPANTFVRTGGAL